MPRTDFRLKPSDKAVKEYYASLTQGAQLQIDHELGVRHAFEALLDRSAHRHFNGGLAREYSVRRGSRTLRPDGCVLDEFRLTRGWYEAKGAGADLEQEARAKLAQGYPRQNTLFWQPGRVLLYQGAEVGDFEITEPTRLVDALRLFFEQTWPYFCLAVDRIVDYLPEAGSQVFPFYTYDSSGSNRQENIPTGRWTPSGCTMATRRSRSGTFSTTCDAILHHPVYRVHYASNLRRDLPRVPLASEFRPSPRQERALPSSMSIMRISRSSY